MNAHALPLALLIPAEAILLTCADTVLAMTHRVAQALVLLACTLALVSAVHAAITSGSLRDEELAPTADNPQLREIDARLAEAVEAVNRDAPLAGPQAHDAFCNCDSRVHGPTVCAAVSKQCRSMFCNPICLNMAWSVELEVDCTAAPGWKYCDVFRQQVLEAEKAISSQFMAHICMQSQFCNRTTELVDWVENHTYGNKYPDHMLPIASCLPSLHSLHPSVAASTCKACGQVVTAKIRRGTCVPGFMTGFETKEMGSVQHRVSRTRATVHLDHSGWCADNSVHSPSVFQCEFVAEYISQHAHSLLLELQQSACTCLGCCDASGPGGRGRECYFPRTEEAWLNGLIDRVTKGVSQRIHQERQVEQRRKADSKRHAGAPQQKAMHPFDYQMKMEL